MKTNTKGLKKTGLLIIPMFLVLILWTFNVSPATERPALDRPITTLRDLNEAFIDIVANVKPAVVTVSTERFLTVQRQNPFSSFFGRDPFFDQFFGPRNQQPQEEQFRQRGLGSGVIVSNDGYILTNNHVVQDADSIFVRTYDNNRFKARIIGTDPRTDIAVIKIDADNLRFLEIGDSDKLNVGEIVLAVGSPMSENLAYSVSQGIISALGRSNVGLADYEDFIQTDAAINPGNSGGPLVNLEGKLIGLNTAIASRSGGFQGIGFAVPSNMAVSVMNSLKSEGRVVRGWMGVYIQDVDENLAEAMGLSSTNGALISDVMSDSPAAKAGIEAGDIIVEIAGKPIANSSDLRNSVALIMPDTKVDFVYLRDGKRMSGSINLGEYPAEGELASGGGNLEDLAGFTVSGLTRDLAQKYSISARMEGVVVTAIDQSSQAFRAGLREGDLIIAINRRRIENSSEFYSIMREMQQGDTVMLRLYRGENAFYMAFTL